MFGTETLEKMGNKKFDKDKNIIGEKNPTQTSFGENWLCYIAGKLQKFLVLP